MTDIHTATPDLTTHWIGWTSLAIFLLAYGLVIAEETIDLRKSTPVVVAAGLMWIMLGAVLARRGLSDQADAALRHVLGEFITLLLFLIAAMTYVNALEERRIFDALRSWLVRSGFSYRAIFWLTGWLSFFISPFADNLTTALVMSTVAISVGGGEPRFVVLSCVGIVVAANSGGAFSPFGDITTLMVWQKGLVSFSEFFALFVPSVVNYLVPAALMHVAVPRGSPGSSGEPVRMKVGAVWTILLFLLTIALAVGVHSFLELPAALGMMTGLGLLMLYDYRLARRDWRMPGEHSFHVFQRMANVEWDTLLFFYGIVMGVGALSLLGYLAVASHLFYDELGPTVANILIGLGSAVFDNIPLMYAVLTMHPDMSHGQWLLVTLTAGVGGSLLSIGSAAGVAIMGQARGTYTFTAHLRWAPVIAIGYATSIAAHMVINRVAF